MVLSVTSRTYRAVTRCPTIALWAWTTAFGGHTVPDVVYIMYKGVSSLTHLMVRLLGSSFNSILYNDLAGEEIELAP